MSKVMAREKPIMTKTYFGPFKDNIIFNFGKLHIRLTPTTSSLDWWCRERSVKYKLSHLGSLLKNKFVIIVKFN